MLKRAIDKDPILARAWVGLAGAQIFAADFGIEPSTTALAGALRAAQRAVELDPMDAAAHSVLAHLVGLAGDLNRSQGEFETALRLNPGSADIMTSYSSWAITFGQAELGAELVDQVIRLNPNYPTWATGPFSYSYIMAGRYKDALHILEQQSSDNYTIYSWINRAVANAAVRRDDEAKIWVKRTLEHFPDLTIESQISGQGLSAAERERVIETMQKTGFPPCATPEQLKGLTNPIRLPECMTQSKP